MTSKHTPGPWVCHLQNPLPAFLDEQQSFKVFTDDGRGNGVAIPGNDGYGPLRETELDEAQANARLISEAPAMLEALRACRDYINREIAEFGARSDYLDTDTRNKIDAILSRIDGKE